MTKSARGASDGAPLIYDIRRDSVASTTSPAKLLENFLTPSATPDPRECRLHQPDGTVRAFTLPPRLRRLPTEILYDAKGLELYEKITRLDDAYYLTGCEREILLHQMPAIAQSIPDGASLIELGCGSMSKTAIVLEHLRKIGKKCISFYALDIEEDYLRASLTALMEAEARANVAPEHGIKYAAILGSYQQAMQSALTEINGPRVFLWLGSSIGNWNRDEAVQLMQSFQGVMEKGDAFLLGVDNRNAPATVALAYNDGYQISAQFGMNGLDHLNELMQVTAFPPENFDYYAGYNAEEGRHEAYYRSLQAQTISVPPQYRSSSQEEVHLEEGELIHYEYSHKYSEEEVLELGLESGLEWTQCWMDSREMYRLCLFEKTLLRDRLGQASIPTLQQWKEVWYRWDQITSPAVIIDYHDTPIHLRHPIIFYIGHIPAFCDIMLAKCLEEGPTSPEYYKDIFERGIDPDVEDPSQCHTHSDVPESWPALDDILHYKKRVRERVIQIYGAMERGEICVPMRLLGRGLHMALEHEIMHTETFLYMLAQSTKTKPIEALPPSIPCASQLAPAKWIRVKPGVSKLGCGDREGTDFVNPVMPERFGWDNESPEQFVSVEEFEIQHRPVTCFEYLYFLKIQYSPPPTELIPASFVRVEDSDMFAVKTVNGPVPVTQSMNWPVALNYHQAEAFMKYLQSTTGDETLRIPSEAELVQFYQQHEITGQGSDAHTNVNFQKWSPAALMDDQVHVYGSLWEWTSTVLEAHDGFESSEMYPGYTSDFFDTKHNIVKGGSWATHARLVGRLRNFYQRSYDYAFIGVRFARSHLVE